eukprot:5430085-Amphidinium_carterae.1
MVPKLTEKHVSLGEMILGPWDWGGLKSLVGCHGMERQTYAADDEPACYYDGGAKGKAGKSKGETKIEIRT